MLGKGWYRSPQGQVLAEVGPLCMLLHKCTACRGGVSTWYECASGCKWYRVSVCGAFSGKVGV